MQREPIVITRRTVGRVASFIGVAALIIGIIGLLWQGAVTPFVGVPLVVGILGIALWAIITPRDFANTITGRQMQRSTVAVFTTLLLIGIVALIYILFARNTLTLDLTMAQRYTLSPETQTVLRRVSRPMRITGFYTSSALTTREVDDQYFRLYEADTNGMITREYINPDEQPAVAQRFGVTNDGQIYLSYVNADGTADLNTIARVPRTNNQERDMTQAISRQLIAGTLTVYFDTALGERDPLDETQEGISGINNGVRESGLITYPISIVELAERGEDIPANAAAVVFARPVSDLTEPQIAVLDRYLQRGGSLFIMSDVLFNENPFLKEDGAFNTYLWENFGIRALDAAVVDLAVSGQTALDVISAYVFSDTDLGERLDPAQNPTMFRIARPLEVNLTSAPPDIANGQVIMTSEQSFGERDLRTLGETNTFAYTEGEDIIGPMPTVVWATNLATNGKIVLIGDSDFVSNGLVMTGGNAVLFTDSMSWLTGLNESIRFQPQMFGVGVPMMFVSTQTLNWITFLTVILLPGIVLVTGLAVWLRRARR